MYFRHFVFFVRSADFAVIDHMLHSSDTQQATRNFQSVVRQTKSLPQTKKRGQKRGVGDRSFSLLPESSRVSRGKESYLFENDKSIHEIDFVNSEFHEIESLDSSKKSKRKKLGWSRTDDREFNDPLDYVEEQTPDGNICWFHVGIQQIRWNLPKDFICQIREAQRNPRWILDRDEFGIIYRNTDDHRIVRKGDHVNYYVPYALRKSSLGARDREIDQSQTALGRKLMRYSERELQQRLIHHGSTRSIMDRRKFLKEFALIPDFEEVNDRINDVQSRSKEILDDNQCPPEKAMLLRHKPTGDIISRLGEKEVLIYNSNPHIQQVFANCRPFRRIGRGITRRDLVAQRDDQTQLLSPQTPYARRQGEVKTVEHWGQRKLLFAELEFMMFYGHLANTVVYAGAAPGIHLEWLSSLFPLHRWILIDPASIHTPQTTRISKIQDFFTDEMAARFKDQAVLFICDVRSADESLSNTDKELRVRMDMDLQQRWVKIMRPKASMLKFRLPYSPPILNFEYFDGLIYLPIWGGRTSTETRLVVLNPDSTRVYNNKEYEDYMFHFHTVTRTSYYEHDVHCDGIDHCFDCAAEVFLLGIYFERFGSQAQRDNKQLYISNLSHEISQKISPAGRTLKLA